MKRVFNFRNTAVALGTVMATFLASAAYANEDPKTVAVEFKYVGLFRSNPVFELQFTNTGTEKDYILIIKDEYGNTLYRESLPGAALNKKFMVNTDEITDSKIRIEISSRKNNHTVVYEINRNNHVTEEIKISRIN
jgi:hypothetical protein